MTRQFIVLCSNYNNIMPQCEIYVDIVSNLIQNFALFMT